MSAPFSTNSLTISKFPPLEAHIKIVNPKLSSALTSAPFLIENVANS